MKGILFKPDVWQAKKKVLEQYGEAQTRRLVNPQPTFGDGAWGWQTGKSYGVVGISSNVEKVFCQSLIEHSRYQVGEVVYRKEAWRIINPIGKYFHNPYDFGIEYLSINHEVKWWTDNGNLMDYPIDEKVRSPLFLPEKYARDFLQITAVRAERLQEITDEDAIAEGCLETRERVGNGIHWESPRGNYCLLWDSINKEYTWDKNPWVWVYTLSL